MGVRVTVELEEATLAKLDALAADTNRPRDLLMRTAVEGFVAHEIAKISRGIAELDRAELAGEEQNAYLASLEPLLSEWNSPEDAEAYDCL
jgi:predicted transcriptional regulator